jgi:hypothetical protein
VLDNQHQLHQQQAVHLHQLAKYEEVPLQQQLQPQVKWQKTVASKRVPILNSKKLQPNELKFFI